jgi:hypothetical protein
LSPLAAKPGGGHRMMRWMGKSMPAALIAARLGEGDRKRDVRLPSLRFEFRRNNSTIKNFHTKYKDTLFNRNDISSN